MREDVSKTVCAAAVDFCFLTPNGRPAIFGYLLYNTYSLNNNSECLFVGAPHKHKDFRRAFEK